MTVDPRLSDLLVRWEELREQGQPAAVEELCRDFPELAEELRRRVRALEALDPVLREAPAAANELSTWTVAPRGKDDSTQREAGVSPLSSRLPAVPGYELLRVVGRGGMGVVYEARHTRLGRRVALKMVLSGAHASEAQRQRFRAEVEAVARLQHPHIVQIYEVGEHDGLPYCALEFVDGGSLDEKIGGTPQPPRQAAELAATLAEAVQAAHAGRIVHRDLKPSNILLTRTGTPKIGDFGLAKRLDGAPGLTATGHVMGTPSYMAPEQAAARKGVGTAADVYALGAILYELLTGRPPFRAATHLETLRQVASVEPVPPSRLQPNVPRDLETICLKCLQKEPGKRYITAQHLADDLRRFLEGKPILARPVPPWERALKWARRRPAAAALLAVGGLAAVVVPALSLAYSAQLRAQRDEADRQRLRAEANFLLARRAVDDYAATLSEDEHMPVEDLRRDLLESALAFYQEFVKQRGDDPALREAQGNAYLRLARITGELGARETQALDLYQQALDVFGQLRRDDPENTVYQQDVALVHYHLGRAYRELGRLQEAEDSLTEARALQERLLDRDPESADCQRHLADIWSALGQVYADRKGDALGPAEAAYQKALGIMEPLAARQPPAPADEDAVGDIYSGLGHVYHARGQNEQARQAYLKALAIEQKLVREHPATVNYRSDLAGSYFGLGSVLYPEGRRQEAWDANQKAREIRERLVEEHGSVTQLAADLGKSYRALGVQSDMPAAALDWFAKSIQTLEGVRKKEPRDRETRSQLGAAYEGRARALTRLGRCTEALDDWGRVEELGRAERPTARLGLAETLARLGRVSQAVEKAAGLDGEDLAAEQRVDLARVYAVCCRAVTADKQTPASQGERLAEQYAAHAVKLLSQAGAAAREGLGQDPDFEPLRARADFQQLLGQPQ
jgi:serine/threonine-protein kinase